MNETMHVYIHPTVTSTTVNCGNITLKLEKKNLVLLHSATDLFCLLRSLFERLGTRLLFRNIMVLERMVYKFTIFHFYL